MEKNVQYKKFLPRRRFRMAVSEVMYFKSIEASLTVTRWFKATSKMPQLDFTKYVHSSKESKRWPIKFLIKSKKRVNIFMNGN